MKINVINNYSLTHNNRETSFHKTAANPVCNNSRNEAHQKVFSSHLGFRGGIPLTSLVNDYKWFINNDKLPAINSFLKIEAPKESLNQLLKYILSNNDTSYEFIDSLVNQPRNISQIYRQLNEKLPFDADILDMYSPNSLYLKAYEKYMDERYKNASSVSELLKIRPDWREDVLLNKHRDLYHNNDFELGFVPDSIGAENFNQLAEHLRKYCTIGFKVQKEIPDLNINGKCFKFKQYIDGKSDKNVFRIDTPDGEKFVIKMASPSQNGLNLAAGLGTLSLVDTYLTQNKCRNAAPLRYYNKNNNIAIYDHINHSTVEQIRTSISDLSAKMPDFKNLGLEINDTIGANNYFKLEPSQKAMESAYDFNYGILHDEVVSVDNDHSTYSQILFPIIDKYHKYLPNEMHMFF